AERLRLQLWLSQLENSYSSLQRSYEDIRLAEASSLDTLTIVEPAEVPTVPIRPKTLRNVLLAAAVGLTLGASVAFLIEYLDDTIKAPADVEKDLGLTTLGTIARFGGKSLEDKLITTQHNRSSVAEAYRILRTNLDFTAVDGGLKAVLVTSPNPVEGKTVTAANLAVVMAQAGRSVILADADLRRPAVHQMFHVPNEAGLTTALVRGEEVSLTDLLQPTEVEGLRVLPSGPLPPNPAELLGSEQMARSVERLKGLADLVILDTAPVLPVADPAILSRVADAVILVVDTGATRRGMALRAMEHLTRAGANIAGVVLNRFSPRGSGYSYYYRYDYYYSSDGHGKGEEEPSASGWRPLVRRSRRERSKASEPEGTGRVIKVKEDPGCRSRL
ncbi:MAG: polysaccharide biosynthesis tyrosine autokinase, partial [Anaerolineae bacterium]